MRLGGKWQKTKMGTFGKDLVPPNLGGTSVELTAWGAHFIRTWFSSHVQCRDFGKRAAWSPERSMGIIEIQASRNQLKQALHDYSIYTSAIGGGVRVSVNHWGGTYLGDPEWVNGKINGVKNQVQTEERGRFENRILNLLQDIIYPYSILVYYFVE